MPDRIVLMNGQPNIYIFEEGCGYDPKPPMKEYDSLKEAIRDNPGSNVLRYPSKTKEF